MYVAGVDVGSTQTKAIVMNMQKKIVARALIRTGANIIKAAENSYQQALDQASINADEVAYVVGTGYGRYKVTFGHAQITEIGCHAKGAVYLFPNTRTVVDIGGQDTKGMKIDDRGEVLDFCMNDKCAAGTGRFLEASAEVMGLTLDEIGPISMQATINVKLTNVCTVFVESEILSHLAWGRKREDILKGVHHSIATRAVGLLRRVGVEDEITFTGGVSRNIGMVKALEEVLKRPINTSEESQFTGAIGATLFAWERAHATTETRRHGDRTE
jgi:predicted CoA-substrate-specific enzyme activase